MVADKLGSSDKLGFSVVRLVFLEVIGGHRFKGENGTDDSWPHGEEAGNFCLGVYAPA